MSGFRFEQAFPLVTGEGQCPATVGVGHEGGVTWLTGPRAMMGKITGFAVDDAGAITVRSAKSGAWGPAPAAFEVETLSPVGDPAPVSSVPDARRGQRRGGARSAP